MNIVTYNKKNLFNYLNSEEYKNSQIIPISFIRGISQINNPRASDNDILLIIIYINSVMAGYLGIVPDKIFFNNISQKIGWMSCIWVDKNARGQGIASKLTLLAAQYYNNNIFATEFTPIAYNLYKKLKIFNDFVNLKGIRIYRNVCFYDILFSHFHFVRNIKPLLKFGDYICDIFINLLYTKNKSNLNNIIEISDFNEDVKQFINKAQQLNIFSRTTEELNWILNYNWVKQVPFFSADKNKYHFTSECKQFINKCYIIKQNNVIKGFVMATIRDNHLKTPYIIVEPGFEDSVVLLIKKLLSDYKIKIITSYQISIINKLSKIKAVYKKTVFRKILTTTNYKSSQLLVQDGDGDCAFV